MKIAASSFKPVWPLFLFVAAFAFSHSAYCQNPVPPEIENEQILGINKQPWHATLVPYADLPQAIASIRAKSSFAQSLNGTWKFHYVLRPEQRPVDFYQHKYDVSHWDNITVPLPGGGPKLHLWRAEYRNDDAYAASGWKDAGLDSLRTQVVSFQSEQLSLNVARITATIEYTGKNLFSVTHTTSTTVYGDGSIAVDNAVMPHGPNLVLAHMGVRMLLDKRLGSVDYLARGPMENYSDRKQGSDIGRYTSTIAQQMTPYSKPMECGNHEDASWVGLKGAGMPTFLAQTDGAPMQFSTLPYTDEEMEPVQYLVDMPPSNATVLCLSAKTLGVGSSSCRPRPWPQYILDSTPTTFSYALRLLPSTSNLTIAARLKPDSKRPKPALAMRDEKGAITLETTGAKLEYSSDLKNWTPYSGSFHFDQGGLLNLRSTSAGQSLITAIPFEARVDRSDWKATASTFEKSEGDPMHVLDGDPNSFWHSQYTPTAVGAPHWLLVDMVKPLLIKAATLQNRGDQPQGGANGRAKNFELYVSDDPHDFGTPVLKGTLPNVASVQILTLPQARAVRYLKFVILNDHSGLNLGSVAELSVVPGN